MADNVTIGISADTTKARADIAVLRQSLADLRKEQRDLAQEQARNKTAGDPAQLIATTRQIQLLEREMAKLTVETRTNTAANKEHSESFKKTGIEIAHLAHASGIGFEALKALRFGLIGLVGSQVIRSLGEVSDRIKEIATQSKQTGFGTRDIQVLDKAFKETGGSAADAKAAVDQLAGAFRDAERAALVAGQTLGGPGVLRGGLKGATSEMTTFGNSAVTTFRGAQQEVVQFADKLKGVHVNIAELYQKFPTSQEQRATEGLRLVAKELNNLVKAGKFAEANLRSLDLSGLSLDRFLPALNKSIHEREKLEADLKKSGGLVDNEAIKKALEYSNAVDGLTEAYQGLQQQVALTVFPTASEWLKQLREFIELSKDVKTLWGGDVFGIQGEVAIFQRNLEIIKGAVSDFITWLDDTLQAAHDKLWKALGEGAKGAGGGPFGDPSIPAMPLPGNASGGYIRGPGSGRSDSILARLSNGEFVLNAGSVRRLGVGFLQGLNSFASGGLVGTLPRFAAGGAVSSPAGFTIVLGGHSFNASTDNATAASLARVARSQSMRSAGRKPGWAN
jgi:hypothetical protein